MIEEETMNTDAMIAALQADGPDPDLAPHLGLFGRLSAPGTSRW